jgi:hypothetical protein
MHRLTVCLLGQRLIKAGDSRLLPEEAEPILPAPRGFPGRTSRLAERM